MGLSESITTALCLLRGCWFAQRDWLWCDPYRVQSSPVTHLSSKKVLGQTKDAESWHLGMENRALLMPSAPLNCGGCAASGYEAGPGFQVGPVPTPGFPWIAQNKFQRSFSLQGVQEMLCCLPLWVLSASALHKSCSCPSTVV